MEPATFHIDGHQLSVCASHDALCHQHERRSQAAFFGFSLSQVLNSDSETNFASNVCGNGVLLESLVLN